MPTQCVCVQTHTVTTALLVRAVQGFQRKA